MGLNYGSSLDPIHGAESNAISSLMSFLALGIIAGTGTGDQIQLVSRGLVVFYGGLATSNQVASINRHPTTPTAGEVVVRAGGSIVIHLDGTSGIVKATSGYWSASQLVINGTAFVGASGVACPTGGIGGSGHNTYYGSNWRYGHSGYFFDRDGRRINVYGGIIDTSSTLVAF